MSTNFLWEGAGQSSQVPINGSVCGVWAVKTSKILVLVDDGTLLIYDTVTKQTTSLACLTNIVSAYPSEEIITVVTKTGEVFEVNINTNEAVPVSVPVNGIRNISATDHHQCLLDSRGKIWVKGTLPYVGTVTACDQFTQLRISPGSQVVQIVTGKDFTAAIVRRNGSNEDDSPDDDTIDGVATKTGPVCPLGLHYSSPTKHLNSSDDNIDDDLEEEEVDQTKEASSSVTGVASSVVSHVTSLGRSVWSNSMSLLSISSQQSIETAPSLVTQNSDTEDGELSVTIPPLVKSRSQPPSGRSRLRRLSSHSEGGGWGDRVTSMSRLCREGEILSSAGVWTWGMGRRGQLGLGDMLLRNNPCHVSLPRVSGHVVKLSAGSHHCLAMTNTGEVWGWGDNTQGQAVYTDIMAVATSPQLVTLQSGEMARDITCHGHVSALLTHNFRCYVFGNIAGKCYVRMQVVDLVSDLGLANDLVPVSLWMSAPGAVVSCRNTDKFSINIFTQEKIILCQIHHVLSILTKLSNPKTSSSGEHLTKVTSRLTSVYHLVTKCVNLTSNHSWQISGMFIYLQPLVKLLSRLSAAVLDCVAADQLLLDNCYQDLVPNIVQTLAVDFRTPTSAIVGQQELEQLLLLLATKLLRPYLEVLKQIQISIGNSDTSTVLCFNISLLSKYLRRVDKEAVCAQNTKIFFQSADWRMAQFRKSVRRIVLNSKARGNSVNVGDSFRNKDDMVVLMNNHLIIQSGQGLPEEYDLATVWFDIEGNKMKIITPEQDLILSFKNQEERNEWVKELNTQIVQTLKAYHKLTALEAGDGEEVNEDEWDNQTPPMARNTKFEFKKSSDKRKYKGGWMLGKMSGEGVMKYQDGSSYDGNWRNGQRQGSGVYIRADNSKLEGSWDKDKLVGKGKIISSGNIYEGYIEDGKPHGHGILRESGEWMSGDHARVYVGSWVQGKKQGYGVLDDIKMGEKYLGMWSDDLKEGSGCVFNIEGVFYRGKFQKGELTGNATMFFPDGAQYIGKVSGFGKFSAGDEGVLYLENKKLKGKFEGRYGTSMRFKGEILTIDKNARRESVNVEEVPVDIKWQDIFTHWQKDMKISGNNVWRRIAVEIGSHPEHIEDATDLLRVIPTKGQQDPLTLEDFAFVEKYLQAAFACKIHPLFHLLNQIINAFTLSYESEKIKFEGLLLDVATKELLSLINRMYNFLKTMFPALPEFSSTSPYYIDDAEKYVTPCSLLMPIFMPSVYPTIFSLYEKRESTKDEMYQSKLENWNKHTDKTLLSFLSVDPKLINNKNGDKKNVHFTSAIETFQDVKSEFTPENKLKIFHKMSKDIETEGSNHNVVIGADILLPVCIYIITRANVPHLGAELAMTRELQEEHLIQGISEYLLQTLDIAYGYILDEKVSEKELESKIKRISVT